MQDLALEIRDLHHVEVHQANLPHPRRRQVNGDGRAQAARADLEHLRLLQFELPGEAHLRRDEMARIPRNFFFAQLYCWIFNHLCMIPFLQRFRVNVKALNRLLKNPGTCHPEESATRRKGSLHLFDFANAGMLRGVYPERELHTLRGVYPERSEWAQDDKRRAQHDIPKTFFNKLLNRMANNRGALRSSTGGSRYSRSPTVLLSAPLCCMGRRSA